MQVDRRALELSIAAIICVPALEAANRTAGGEAAKREASVSQRRTDVGSGKMIGRIAARHQAERCKAAREIAELKDPASAPVLIRLLHDDNASVRGSAAWGLRHQNAVGSSEQPSLLRHNS